MFYLSSVCSIYFPDVTPAFAKYCEQRDALHKVLAEHKDRYKSGMAGKEFFPPFHRGMLELISRSKELKKQRLLKHINSLARTGFGPGSEELVDRTEGRTLS
jgi:hypothetical protein